MEGFTIVDAGVLVVVLLSAILAYSRGLVREIFAILGWVAAGIAGFYFAAKAAPLIKQIPVLDKFLGDNCELSTIAGFFAVFAGALILVSIFTPLFSAIIQRSALSGIDQGLGFLFGVARGVLLVAVAFLVYDRLMAEAAVPMVDNSRSAAVFASVSAKLNEQVPSDAPGWIAQQYNTLVGACGAETTVDPAATGATGTGAAVDTTNTTGAKTVTP
ncbi:MAG: CvpA family protein [Caulobacteraceae bacterium]|nr:CvpA family protein [Caulobacteraceae bacterium]